jgi:hypothetical protein
MLPYGLVMQKRTLKSNLFCSLYLVFCMLPAVAMEGQESLLYGAKYPEQEELLKQKMPLLYSAAPLDVWDKMDEYCSEPFTVVERPLSREEHAQYNSPFAYELRYKSRDDAGKFGHILEDVIQYMDPATQKYRDISVLENAHPGPNIVNGVNHACFGPCTIADNDEICVINNGFILTAQPSFFGGVKKETIGKITARYFLCLFKEGIPHHSRYADFDNDTGVLYVVAWDGEILTYTYSKAENGFQNKKSILPPLSGEMLKELYNNAEGTPAQGDLPQFDHKQPDILVRNNLFDNSYAVLHRPSKYVFQSPVHYDYDAQEDRMVKRVEPSFPLLASDSPCRLRFLGDRINVKTITVHPTVMKPSGLYILHHLIPDAKNFCNWLKTNEETASENEIASRVNKAQTMINVFKKHVPEPSERYYWVWCSQNEDKSYALGAVHAWLQVQKARYELMYGLL